MRIWRRIAASVISASMLISAMPVVVTHAETARHMENLDRGLVAMMNGSSVYLSWRLLGTEDYETTFDVYRDGSKIATAISNSTNYTDNGGSKTSTYQVVPTGQGVNGAKTAVPFASGENYIEIPVAPIEDYDETHFGTEYEYEYRIHDASVGDLDGDGEYEIIVKREANHQHAAQIVDRQLIKTFNRMYLEAYKLDGTILWRIDMGENMQAMTEFVFLVADFNNDGSAEVACRTAPGTKDGTGAYVTEASAVPAIKNADNTAYYRNSDGHVSWGPEYFTLFDGENGQALDTIEYPVLRGIDADNNITSTNVWGDTYGHRTEKCMGVVSYFDGVNPGIGIWRGIYYGGSGSGPGRTAAANISVDNSTNRMTVVNRFDTWSSGNGYKSGYEKYIGQGNHSVAVGDVDNDGKDEFMSGGLCLDDDLKPLWCTYRGHGDAHHLAEYDPTNNSLEYMNVQEEGIVRKNGEIVLPTPNPITNDFGETFVPDHGMTLIHALDGKELFHEDADGDTGRGMMANTGAGGFFQFWGVSVQQGNGKKTDSDPATDNDADTYDFETMSYKPAGVNFRIFWDSDVYDELFDSYNAGTDQRPVVYNYNTSTQSNEIQFIKDDVVTINGTKSAPLLQADIFGDWREELVLKTPDDMAMRIYTTNIQTTNKLYTLMHDSLYRQGVALQNQYYNQPPHISYYVSEPDNATAYEYDQRTNKPDIQTIAYDSASAPSATATPVETRVTSRNSGYLIDEDGDYYSGVNDTSMVNNGWSAATDGSIARQVVMATTNDTKYLKPAESKKHINSYNGKFLLFSANGADSKFETKASSALSGTGKLKFNFFIPSTFSDNGSYAYGNAPTTLYLGDGTNNALEFTITPYTQKGYVTAAKLTVNGTDVCSFASGEDAQTWTSVDCSIDHANKRANIAVTKADGKIYTATVDYVSSGTGTVNTFGIDASKYYGTVAVDAVKLYPTSSLEAIASKTADFSAVSGGTTPKTSEHFYELDLSDLPSGQITQKVTTDESKSDASTYNVANFRTATAKTAAIPDLDGWGYVHAAYDNTSGRQTAASVDVDNNAMVINGTSNVGGGTISFIPKNIEGKTMPTTGILTYSFTAIVSKSGGSAAGSVNYGFTSSTDGSSLNSIAATTVSQTSADTSVSVPIVMTYNLTTKAYSIKVDGTEKASGSSSSIKGIYAQSSKNSYTNGSIKDLIVDYTDDGTSSETDSQTVLNVLHTASAVWGNNNPTTTTDSEKEHFNNDHASSWGGSAFMTFDLSDISNPESATLNYSVLGESRSDRTFKLYYISSDIDITSLSANRSSLFTDSRVEIATATAPKSATADLSQNVLEAVSARLAAGSNKITFMLTDNAGGGDLYGKASSNSPTLTVVADENASTPSPTPTAAPTATPTPTATPEPTATPTATPTPTPTATPTPTPEVTATPAVTATPEVTATPAVTATPEVSAPEETTEPQVTATPEVTPTAAPTATPEATAAPTSSLVETDTPTETDAPEATIAPTETATPEETPGPTESAVATEAPAETDIPVVPTQPPSEEIKLVVTDGNVHVENLSKMPFGNGCVIAAKYDDNGILQKIKLYRLYSDMRRSMPLYNDFEDGDNLTLLLWDSESGMIPYDKTQITISK